MELIEGSKTKTAFIFIISLNLEVRLNKMKNMKFDIDTKTYEEIAKLIHSDESPVGIDAKKTHILILNKLQELSDRLERMEQKMAKE